MTATLANGHAWDVEVGDEQDIVCTITNTRKTGELEVIKDLEPSDDPGLFDLLIDGTSHFDDASDGDTTGTVTVDTGTHTVGEAAGTDTSLGDYDSDISCLDDGGTGSEVASGSGAGPLNVEVGEDDDIVCTITNTRKTVTLEVIKDLEPSDDPGLFDLLIDGTSHFDDASDGDTTGAVTVNTGNHTVGEAAGTGTSLGDYSSSIECVNDAGATVASSSDAGPLNVPVNEDVVCTITNTRKAGSLEVIKDLEPSDDPGLFDLLIDGTSHFDDASDGDTTGTVNVNTGTHTVGEAAGTGTSLDDYTSAISCLDDGGTGSEVASGSGAGPLNVEVGEDDQIVCTITNTRKTGELEVIKDLSPDDDPGLFDLQIDGSTEFADASDGDTTGAVTVNTGTHTVGELAGTGTDLDDYNSSIECRNDAGTGTVVASASGTGPLNVEVDEDHIVCTITNTRKTGELEVIKDLSPDDDPGLFDLQIDGSTEEADASDGDTTGAVTVNTGTHTVGELAGTGTDLGDYASDISCVDEGGQGAEVAAMIGTGPLDVEVGEDDHIVCTITNVFIQVAGQPIITVEKTNDADGDGTFRNQERGIEGDSVTFKVVIRNVSTVPVVIDEITDTFGGQTINICPELIGITINPGGSRTCFFTLDNYVPAPGELLENTVTVRGHSADDETQTVEASDDSAVNSIEVLGGGTGRGTDEGTTLAFTGAELLMLALMALSLIAVGMPLVVLTRRRGGSLDG